MNEQRLRDLLDDLATEVPSSEVGVDMAWRRGRRRRLLRVAGGAAVVVVVLGIGIAPWSFSRSGTFYTAAEHPVPFATYHRTGSLLALIEGARLSLEDGCVYVRGPNGNRTPLMFPRETRWNPSRQVIELDGTEVRMGEKVNIGGGLVSASRAEHIPTSCRYDHDYSLPFFQVGGMTLPGTRHGSNN
jgi:hypothetical protein